MDVVLSNGCVMCIKKLWSFTLPSVEGHLCNRTTTNTAYSYNLLCNLDVPRWDLWIGVLIIYSAGALERNNDSTEEQQA